MLTTNRDLNYAKIVRSRDRGKMYKYRLIRSIIMDLDEYIKENKLTSIDNESTLLSTINLSYRQHSLMLTGYFKVTGYNINITINTSDIEDWTYKYKWHHKLYVDDDDKLIYG